MHRIAFAAVLAAGAGLAQAQGKTFSYETELAQAARRAAATAGGVSWTCAGTRCTASGRGGNVSVKGCSELARAYRCALYFIFKEEGRTHTLAAGRLADPTAVEHRAAFKAATGARLVYEVAGNF